MSSLTIDQTEDCLKASKAYRAVCERDGIDPKYIKHFSTWANSWRDYLDPDYGTSLVKPSKGMSDDEFFAGIRKSAGA
jgi:hypothetical protein